MSGKHNHQHALVLAGKVALAARALLDSNVLHMGERLSTLDLRLKEYDDYIVAWALEPKTPSDK